MKYPPWILRLRIQPQGRRYPTLWIPVFMLWPLFVPLFLILLILSRRTSGALYDLLCEMRGTRIDVVDAKLKVLITIH